MLNLWDCYLNFSAHQRKIYIFPLAHRESKLGCDWKDLQSHRCPRIRNSTQKLPPLLPPDLLACCTSCPGLHGRAPCCIAAAGSHRQLFVTAALSGGVKQHQKRAGRRMPEDNSEQDVTSHLEERQRQFSRSEKGLGKEK